MLRAVAAQYGACQALTAAQVCGLPNERGARAGGKGWEVDQRRFQGGVRAGMSYRCRVA